MKKLLLAIFCLFLCAGVKAQTFTDGHLTVTVTDSMHHDSAVCGTAVYVFFHISIDSSYIGETVNVIDTVSASLTGTFVNTSGVSPWNFVTNAGGASTGSSVYSIPDYSISRGYAHTMTYYSIKKITAGPDTLITTGSTDSILITNSCTYSTVSGRTYVDNNANCVFDAGDQALNLMSGLKLSETFMPPGGGYGSSWLSGSYSGSTGNYSLQGQQSWVATCTVSLPSYYYFVFATGTCTAGPYVFTSLPATGADFPFQCTSNVDVQCAALSPGFVRLHTPFRMQPYVSNTGCDPASGQMKLIKDPHVIYNAALSTHPADVVVGDTLIWNYSGLTNLTGPGYWNSFMSNIHLTPDPTVAVGDTLCFRVFANVPSADINPANNDYSFCLPVVYSYDPNLKEVSPQGTGPQGYIAGSQDTLTYTLHFQNTGSAAAYNIKVTDTLDSDINPASFRILGTSHNMTPQWLTPNVVQFVYNNINLPDSNSNEPASHGSVRFSVKLKSGRPAGTQIKNTGYIYFDLNPAVVTNTVLNTLSSPTGIEQIRSETGVKVYPNPATDNITVENLGGGELVIVNLTGSVMVKQHIANDRATIDVSTLPAGVYVLKTSNNNGSSTDKFIKY